MRTLQNAKTKNMKTQPMLKITIIQDMLLQYVSIEVIKCPRSTAADISEDSTSSIKSFNQTNYLQHAMQQDADYSNLGKPLYSICNSYSRNKVQGANIPTNLILTVPAKRCAITITYLYSVPVKEICMHKKPPLLQTMDHPYKQ
jgi:hypothetical protein